MLNQLRDLVILQKKPFLPDGSGGWKAGDSIDFSVWACVHASSAVQNVKISPRRLRAGNFSLTTGGEKYDVIIREGLDMHHVDKMIWKEQIFSLVTPPHPHSCKGYMCFGVMAWKNKDFVHE